MRALLTANIRLALQSLCAVSIFAVAAAAQSSSSSIDLLLERLSKLEQQNLDLQTELRSLRAELDNLRNSRRNPQSGPPPSAIEERLPAIEERLQVTEARIEEHAHTKLEASQKFPIRLTGMALMNAFWNSPHSGGSQNPTVASLDAGRISAGGTVRQSVIGLQFHGPSLLGGGRASGSLFMDFFAGTPEPLNQTFRIRTASLQLDWKNTSILLGQEKPIISPREPNSLAQVGVSPLTNAGNLWLWLPQARIEQRFHAGEVTQFRVQAGVLQSRETASIVPPQFASAPAPWRPAWEGRFELTHQFSDDTRLELASAFHTGSSRVFAQSIPSRLWAADWLLRAHRSVEWTGTFFSGQNLAGLGALRQGFTILGPGEVIPVHSRGGWSQVSLLPHSRLTFNLLGGQHDDRNSDIMDGGFAKNQAYGANVMIRLAPNVVLSFENLRLWTTYLNRGTRRNNHYDLALAYLF
jgi:hypothetical protein